MLDRAFLIVALAVSSALGGVGSALAGAWTLEQGRGLIIAEIGVLSADSRFDRERERVDASAFRKTEGRLLVEYGLSERVTLRGKTAYEGWRQDGFDGSQHRGPGVQEIGGRLRLIERGSFVGSAEASLRVAEAHDGGGVELEYEARVLGGYGFTVADRPAFVDAQLGYRLRPEAMSDDVIVDLTAGIRPWKRTLLLLQSFSTIAAATSADGLPAYDRHKLQASVVFDLTERWSLQAGVARTVAGADSLEERSAFAAVWMRF